MTIGIPIGINESSIVASVEDATEEYNPYTKQGLPNGKRFKQGTNIYQNTGDTIVVQDFDATKTYVDGDVVFGNPYGIVGLDKQINTYIETNGTVPQNPQDYNNGVNPTDVGMDYTVWAHRYTKIADKFDAIFHSISITVGDTTYTFLDKQNGYVGIYIGYGNNLEAYPDDILAYTRIVTSQLDDPAELIKDGSGTFLYIVPHSIIINETGVYMRTNLSMPVQYTTTVQDIWYPNNTVESLNGFTYIERINKFKPFDKKAYTAVEAIGTLSYKLKSLSNFNSIVLSGVKADSITVKVRDTTNNNALIQTFERDVDGSRDVDKILDPTPTTEIFYATNTAPNPVTNITTTMYTSTHEVEVILIAPKIELGMIMLTQSIDNGFTNLTLKNSYKDFSTFQYDPFGNVDYVERAKVSTYTATVDILIEDYDRTDRLMKSIGKNVVVIDGADNLASGKLDKRLFTSTQKIGRILSYSQQTKVTNNDMDEVATYNMSIEEIV